MTEKAISIAKSTPIKVTLGVALAVLTWVWVVSGDWRQMQVEVKSITVYVQRDKVHQSLQTWILTVIDMEHGHKPPSHITLQPKGTTDVEDEWDQPTP